MPQLNPGESFPIVRALSDPNDAATNYVQAVIVDATTDATIAAIKLTDKGSQRFKNIWQVPSDNVFGRGRYITITTTVYTDSNYSVLNGNYAKQTDTYLIQQRMDLRFMPGGGMNTDDYRKVLLEGLATLKFPDPPKYEAPKPLDTTPLIDEIDRRIQMHIQTAIGSLPTPDKPDKVDLTSIHTAIGTLAQHIQSLPRFEKTDHTGLMQALEHIHGAIQEHAAASAQAHQEAKAQIDEKVVPIMEETAHENVIQGIRNGSINLSLKKSPEQQKKESVLKRLQNKYKK